jgi:serine/threonine protein phosphatase 1
MLSRLRQLFGAVQPAPTAAIPAGERIYAVGDIHGCADLFEALIAGIDADDTKRGAAASHGRGAAGCGS